MKKLATVLTLLARQEALPPECRDHALREDWVGFRDLHIEPDWLLICRIAGDEVQLEGKRWSGRPLRTTSLCAASDFTATNRMVGRWAASTIAAASFLSFFCLLTNGFTFTTILYLGFHGKTGKVCLGSKQEFSLGALSMVLDDFCRHRVIHFGSCSTLEMDNARLKEFRRQAGALALFGYKSDVDWLHAIAFEVLLLGELQYHSFTYAGMKGLDSRLKKAAATLRENLGFGMHYGRL